jgi:hypothetical protein
VIGRAATLLAALAGALLLATATGCTLEGIVAQAGVPGASFDAKVSNLKERGSYLDAFVETSTFSYRLFFPADDTCRALLSRSEGLRFTWLALMGRVTDGETRCDAVGVLSLVAWRDRQPRRSREPLPRAPARYHEVYRDPDLVLLYGRFPLASQLGFQGTGQLIAVIPNEEPCTGLVAQGTASMEYRVNGDRPLTLIDGDRLCTLLGLAQPPPQT